MQDAKTRKKRAMTALAALCIAVMMALAVVLSLAGTGAFQDAGPAPVIIDTPDFQKAEIRSAGMDALRGARIWHWDGIVAKAVPDGGKQVRVMPHVKYATGAPAA